MRCQRICVSLHRRGYIGPVLLVVLLWSGATGLWAQLPWSAIGPDGGDARAFAAVPDHPNHLYLGTTNSWIYESTDSGSNWHRLSKLGTSSSLVVDHIVVDSSDATIIYAAAWALDASGGGLWISHDGGRTWSESADLHGQSIRAFVQAASDPATLFAGTLEGVFRSEDGRHTVDSNQPAAEPRNP